MCRHTEAVSRRASDEIELAQVYILILLRRFTTSEEDHSEPASHDVWQEIFSIAEVIPKMANWRKPSVYLYHIKW